MKDKDKQWVQNLIEENTHRHIAGDHIKGAESPHNFSLFDCPKCGHMTVSAKLWMGETQCLNCGKLFYFAVTWKERETKEG